MSCCGKNRQTAAFDHSTPISPAPAPAGTLRVRPLEYVGEAALSVLGPATGRIYRFQGPGSRVSVDPRDWSALARLPQLRPA